MPVISLSLIFLKRNLTFISFSLAYPLKEESIVVKNVEIRRYLIAFRTYLDISDDVKNLKG